MPMDSSAATDLVSVLMKQWEANYDKLSKVDRWYRGKLLPSDMPVMPAKHTHEYTELRDRSLSNWLKLAVTVVAQSMYIDGYRRSDDNDDRPIWRVWQANRMDARQNGLWRGALAHGVSYLSVLPGKTFTGESMPAWKGHSGRLMTTVYQDDELDEWPMYALQGEPITGSDGAQHWRFRLYDAEAIYIIDFDAARSRPTFIEFSEHGAGCCPVVRIPNLIDLEGRCDGEVEPYIDLNARINQDVFDRLVVQRFGAWLVRYIAGMAEPETDAEKRASKLRLSIEDILIAGDPDTKFGTLPATPMDGYLKAHDSDVHSFAALTQTPATDLLGQMINLSAEALAAAEAGKSRKIQERQHYAGEGIEQAARLSAHYLGDSEGASDFGAQVLWRDMESRSLSQVADALGKLATQLGVPAEALWERIPGVTQSTVESWRKMAGEGGMEALMDRLLQGQTSPVADPV